MVCTPSRIGLAIVALAAAVGQAQTVLYVDDDATAGGDGLSWATAYDSLTPALSQATAGGVGEIRVARGVYRPAGEDGPRVLSFPLINGVAVKGGYAGLGAANPDLRNPNPATNGTVLSGDLNGDDVGTNGLEENSYHVLFAGSSIDSTAIFDGFEITGGNADGDGSSGHGGGLFTNGGPTLLNCFFDLNSAIDGGGVYNTGDNTTLSGCTFSGNSSSDGGGMYNYNSSPQLSNCTFLGNVATGSGGGIYNYAYSSSHGYVYSNPDLVSCTFSENMAQFGGGLYNVSAAGGGYSHSSTSNAISSPSLVSCRFSGNFATTDGGGIYNTSNKYGSYAYATSEPTLANCTFSENTAGSLGEALYNVEEEYCTSDPIIGNCIFWQNGGASAGILNESGTLSISYSLIQGGWSGTGNLDMDPLFVDADGEDNIPGTHDDDLRLALGSPCIDSGDNYAVPDDTTDLDGDGNTTEPVPFDLDGGSRFVDVPLMPNIGSGTPPIVDMGTYEVRDCNFNGLPDSQDIAGGTSEDCNANQVPDECDIAEGSSLDDNGNSVPDECEFDCVANELAKFLASDGAAGDYFGNSVSISGDTAVIGALLDDDNDDDSGSAYVFRFNGLNWVEEAKLVASDGAEDDRFGYSVSISGDTAVIGAYGDDDNGSYSGSAYVFRFDGLNWVEEAKLLASDGVAIDHFGNSVSISGDTAVIGAYDDNGSAGSAYVFRFDGLNWVEEAKLLASDGAAGDKFGHSVSISGDTAVIGARYDDDNGSYSGSAYVFRFDGLNWVEETKLLASDGAEDDQFGKSVSISGDTAVIGANGDDDNGSYSGSAYVFRFNGLNWVEEAKLLASDCAALDYFGWSVSISGDTTVIGAYRDDNNGSDSGSAYVFSGLSDCNGNEIIDICDTATGMSEDCNSNGLPDECDIAGGTSEDLNGNGVPDECEEIDSFAHERAKLLASDGAADDWFGRSVSISGDTAVIGACGDNDNGNNSGSAYVFRSNGLNWVEETKLLASDGAANDWFGYSVSISGNTAVIGARNDDDNGGTSGSAYVFRFNGSNWVEEAKLLASDGALGDQFGFSVFISGDTAVIGAHWDDDNGNASGSAYVFRFDGLNWVEEAKLLASDGAGGDYFGISVSISGDTAVIGASEDDDNGGNSGSAYVFRFNGLNWVEEAKLLASDGVVSHWFGSSVSISGDTAVIGAFGDDDNGSDSGSAYVFRFNGLNWVEEAKLLASDGAEDDRFGRSVSISGDTAVIGAPATYGYASGSAYVFRFNGLNWVEEAKLLASDGVAGDYFGRSVSVSGDTTVIGAWADDDNGDDSGSAYVFSGWDVLFVDATATGANNGTTWADAYTELRDALAEAGTSEWITAIWVAAGTYTPAEAGGDRSASFELLNGVAIYGGFAGGETGIDQRDPVANKTILSGDLNGDDVEFLYQDENSYHVVISSYADTAVLDGFTITAGNADGTPGNDTSGAGMSNIGGSPTLKSCTFLWNRANTAGGGMSNAFGSPTLSDCVFISNYALEDGSGGAIWTFESDLTLNNCTFLWNSADKDGGGMYISSGSPTLTGCTFESNVADFDGGGIYVFSGGSPTLTNCKLSWNFTAIGDGGGMYNGWIPTLVNCQFSDNVAVNGGGIYDEAGLPTLVNCSFNGNAADDSGGGMFNNESDPLLINCAFSGNSARSDDGGGLYNDDSTLTLTNCTFSKNSAHSSGGGVYNLGDGIPWVTNCVFWQNTRNAGTETDESAQIDTGSAATIVNYSCVQGGWSGVGGIGNIDADPMFVDADGPDNIAGTEDDDLHLFGGSPCNDAGNNYAVPPWILHDRDGNTRFSDDPAVPDTGDGTPPIVDMGAYELLLDCNTNGVTDDQDISSGTSQDCNGNGIPDECERDCNANAVADECDIAAGTSVDCNNNGIPDECDLAAGTSEDCQPNDIPDECDLALGTSQDCNSNNMPDECDLVGYMTSSITNGAFETEDWTGWQRGGTGDWYITLVEDFSGNACTNDLSPIPPESKSVRMYNGGPASMYLCQTIDIPAGLVDPTLAWADVICSAGDFSENQRFSVEIGSDCCSGQAEEVLFETQRGDQLVSEEWAFREVPIEAFAGRTVDLAFKVIAQGNCFDLWLDNIHIFENRSPDCNTNSIPDECDLTAGTSNDCNTNGIPDECDIAAATSGDCNINTIPDECDLAAGTSEDCNSNDTPDECEIDQNSSAPNGPHYCTEDCAVDCNSNGIPDECDLAAGTSNDCNGNAVPDECDLAVGTSADCNSNVIPDECDVAGGTSADCQPNTIPDECEADCNANGTPDECDLAAGTSADCQSNGIPDECDIDPSDPDDNGQVSPDCNTNGVPDECETDCNTNGVPDDCDIAGGTSDDCNGNGTPDKCEIDQNSLAPNGPYYCTENCAEDCNDNGIPDECDLSACPAGNPSCADCNSNSIPDECDIDSATSTDCNNTGVPDKCELWSGDCNMNGFPDDCDVAEGTSPDVNGNGAPDECEADCNTNGVPDDWDVAIGTSWDTNSNALPDECEAALHDSLLAADAEVNGLDVISLDTLAGGLAGLLVGVSDSAVLDNVAYEPVSGMAYVALHDPADDDNLSLYRVALSMWWAFPLTNYNESPQRGAGVACALAFDASEIPHVLYLGYRDEAAGGPPYVQHIQVVNAHAGDIDLGTVIADYALDIGNIQLRGLAHHLVHDDLYAVCSVGAQGRLYRVMLNALRQEASLEFIRATSQVFDNLAYDSTRNRLVAVADSRLYEVEPTADGVDLCVGGGFVSNVDPPGLAYRDSGITTIDPSPWEEIPEGSGTARGMGISSSCAGAQYPSVAIDAETLAPVVAWSDGSVIHVRRYAPQTPDAEGEEPDMAPWKDVPPTSTGISESGAHTPAITIVPEAVAEIDGNNVYVVAWSQETFSGAREIFVKGFDGSGDTAWEEIGLWSANPFGFGISGTGVDSLDPVIASDRAGTPIIAWNEMDDEWYDFRQVYVRRWDAIAEDWVEMGAGSAVGGGISDSLLGATDVALVMDVFDRPIIAWADLDGDTGEEGEDEQYEIYVLRWNGLNAWEELSLGSAGGGGVSNSPLHDRYPALAADQLGNVYLAWSACAEEDCSCTPPGPCSQIKVRRWNSNTWSELAESMADSGISDTPGASLWPAVTVNPAGNLVVAWRDESTASAQILARAWDGDNQEWIEVGAGSAVGGGISATTHSADAGPVTLAAAADNIIVAAWHHELNDAGVDQVFVRRYTELIGPPVVGEAYDPIPESGAQFNTNGVTLAWSAGVNAAKFDVYFGTDRIQVAAATRDDDPYGLRIATDLTEMWHGPVTGLDSNTWYYWRVDSWGFGSVAPTKGAIWNFYVFSTEQLQPETRLIAAVADVSPIQGVVGLELQGDQNRGVDERLAVGLEEGQGQIRRALIKFDLCDFASTNGMLITHADLELYVAIGPMQDEEVEVYRMRHEWQEGTQQAKYGNIRGEPDGASWNTSDGVTPWPQLDAENGIYGAGYVENASDLLGSKILPAGTNGLVRIPLDTAKVQEWALLDFVNNGILVKTSNTAEARAGSAMYFHSINAQEPGAMPPQLLLEYFSSVGEPRPFLECVDGFADATCNGPTQGHLADTPYPVTLAGEGFTQGMTITVEGHDHSVIVPSELLDVSSNGQEVTFPLPPFPPGENCALEDSFEVKITVSNGCETKPDQPLVFTYNVSSVHVFPGQDLQAVINDAPAGTCIVLEPGVHDGPISFVSGKSAITVTSTIPTQPGFTKIDGPYQGDVIPDNPAVKFDNCGGRIEFDPVSGTGSATIPGAPIVLRGINVRLGNGGIVIENASPLIMDCRVDDNFARAPHAGGITIEAGSHPVIVDCAVEGNYIMEGPCNEPRYGGGIRVNAGAVPTIVGCSIASNTIKSGGIEQAGGGVYFENTPSSMIVANNAIRSNKIEGSGNGGGVCWAETAAGRFFLNIVEENTAPGGSSCHDPWDDNSHGHGPGIYCSSGAKPSLDNNLIDGNGDLQHLNKGGGIYIADFNTHSISIRENVIRNNVAQYGGAMYLARKTAPEVVRNIIADNVAHQPYDSSEQCPQPPLCPIDAYESGIIAIDAEPDLINNTIHGNERVIICPHSCLLDDDEQGSGFHGQLLVTGDLIIANNLVTDNENGWELFADTATTAAHVVYNLAYDPNESSWLISSHFNDQHDNLDTGYDDPLYEQDPPDVNEVTWPRDANYPNDFRLQAGSPAIGSGQGGVDMGVIKFDAFIDANGGLVGDGASYATLDIPYATTSGLTERTGISIEVHDEPAVNTNGRYVYVAARDLNSNGSIESAEIASFHALYEFEPALQTVSDVTIEMPLLRPITPTSPFRLYYYSGGTYARVDGVAAGKVDHFRQVVVFESVTIGESVLLRGDVNNDGKVDLDDYAIVHACLGGPDRTGGLLRRECAICDLDNDDDVDLVDYAVLQQAFTAAP